VTVQAGGTASLARVASERSHGSGVFVIGFRSEALVSDLALTDNDGAGMALQSAAGATVERMTADGNAYVAILVAEEETTLVASDVAVHDTRARGDGYGGGALAVFLGAEARVRRALFQRNRAVTVAVGANIGPDTTSARTHLLLEDVRIEDTRPVALEELGLDGVGRGVSIEPGADAVLARVVVEGSHETGIAVLAATATMTDVVVRGTESNAIGAFGRGMHVQGSVVGVTRGLFEDNREVTVSASLPDARLSLSDVLVRGTRERACAVDACVGYGSGVGVGSYYGASVRVERFRISDNALAGVQLARGVLDEDAPAGSMDLAAGVVSGNPVGANVQHAGYDLDRLTRDVVYADNLRNLDSAELVVPDAHLGPSR
jgi:hypothetical protein